MHKHYKILLIITLIINLFSCAQPSKILKINNLTNDDLKNIAVIENWHLTAKVQFTDLNSNFDPFIGYMDWKKSKPYTLINFRSYFNINYLTIKSDNYSNKIEILEHNINDLKILDPRKKDLDLKIVNLNNLKLNNLNYWLLGIPDPKLNYIITSKGFIQNNWSINYENFTKVILNKKTVFIPHKITLQSLNTKLDHKIKIITKYLKFK